MPTLTNGRKTYAVDELGFLLDFQQWDEDFARAMAPELKIPSELSDDHWRVIRYIHAIYQEEGRCPLVSQTCKANGLRMRGLEELFPTGYLRGACKLAGITYRHGYHGYGSIPGSSPRLGTASGRIAAHPELKTKKYTIDIWGFLVEPSQWDEHYAAMRAADMKMPELTQKHWEVIGTMRRAFERTGRVPTVYETCAASDLEIEELAGLFPDGYHRGAVKIAGLRAAE